LVPWSDISAARDVEAVAQRRANAYLVEIHKKWAISVACLTFVIVGIPMALRFPRGGMGLVIGGGLSVFAIYYVGLTAGESLGDLGRMAPWIPMWAPNILLMTFGILGMLVVARHTGTARGGDFADLWDSIRHVLPRRRAAG
jgi:lipopolysaccharide export system permease protein